MMTSTHRRTSTGSVEDDSSGQVPGSQTSESAPFVSGLSIGTSHSECNYRQTSLQIFSVPFCDRLMSSLSRRSFLVLCFLSVVLLLSFLIVVCLTNLRDRENTLQPLFVPSLTSGYMSSLSSAACDYCRGQNLTSSVGSVSCGLPCTTVSCVNAATTFLEAMDLSADPCSSAYQYVCGRFEKETEIREDEGTVDLSFHRRGKRTRMQLKELYEEVTCLQISGYLRAKKEPSHDEKGDITQWAQNLSGPSRKWLADADVWDEIDICQYESCLNTPYLDYLGASPLLDLVYSDSDLHWMFSHYHNSTDTIMSCHSETNIQPQISTQVAISDLATPNMTQHSSDHQTPPSAVPHTASVLGRRLAAAHMGGASAVLDVDVTFNILHPHLNTTLGFDQVGGGLSYAQYEHPSFVNRYIQHIATLLQLFENGKQIWMKDHPDEVRLMSQNASTRSIIGGSFSMKAWDNRPVDDVLSEGKEAFAARARDVLAIELDIRSISRSPVATRDVVNNTNPLPWREVRDSLLPYISLAAYAEAVERFRPPSSTASGEQPTWPGSDPTPGSSDVRFTLGAETEVLVGNPDYLPSLRSALPHWRLAAFQDYLRVRIIRPHGAALSKVFRDEFESFTFDLYQVKAAPRWRQCLMAGLSWPLARRYVKSFVEEGRKEMAEYILDEVVKTFRHHLTGEVGSKDGRTNNVGRCKYEWMDDETRGNALHKLEKLGHKMGYPDWLLDRKQTQPHLLESYGEAEPLQQHKHDLFKTALILRKVGTIEAMRRLGKPLDRTKWSMAPYITNAYYSGTRNEMVFPSSVLSEPFLFPWRGVGAGSSSMAESSGSTIQHTGTSTTNSLRSQEEGGGDEDGFVTNGKSSMQYVAFLALSLGAYGSVVAHELTHGFDDQGRMMDGTGKLEMWWTDYTNRMFGEQAQCFVDQYSTEGVQVMLTPTHSSQSSSPALISSSPAIPSREYLLHAVPTLLHPDGALSLGENIADNGGLGLARDTLLRLLTVQELNAFPLPGITLTTLQLFYAAYAHLWCSKGKGEVVRDQVESDVHSVGRLRVDVALKNVGRDTGGASIDGRGEISGWGAEFGCPKNSKMRPENTCEVW
eukprot:GHVQ01028594.1.p1 GENE.GHVQ01028594.1~~GHVQ01028594.1.p1  ORF type:complete len:1096 (-),score=152.71 GHVQ01028594.1:474-3761(-)